MNERLDIPLSINPTRHLIWRVVHVSAYTSLLVIGGWVLFRAFTTFNQTPAFGPEDTTLAVRILHTPKSARMIDAHLSNIQLLPGSPWSLGDMLSTTKRGLNLFTHGSDVTAVLDYEAGADMVTTAQNYGYSITVSDGITVLSTAQNPPTFSSSLPRIQFSALRPSAVALLGTTGITTSVLTDNNNIIISSQLLSAPETTSPIDTGSTSMVSLKITSAMAHIFETYLLPENTPGAQYLARIIGSDGANIELYEHNENLYYRIAAHRTEVDDLSAENLSAVGREIVGIPDLTLNELTLPDGTAVQELKSPNVEETVHDEHPYTFVTISSERKTIRLSLSPELVTLTNASVLPTDNGEVARSVCLRSAHAWIKPRTLNTYVPRATRYHAATPLSLLLNITEVASSKTKTRVCW